MLSLQDGDTYLKRVGKTGTISIKHLAYRFSIKVSYYFYQDSWDPYLTHFLKSSIAHELPRTFGVRKMVAFDLA